MRRRLTLALLLLPISALATTFTVKAGGGGNFTTINACTTQMSASGGDTCTVFAGTYTENPSINAGLASSYNVLTVNGSDIVTVNGQITVNSHTKAIGNCPALQGTQTTATCGFFVQNASSPTTNCFTVAASATDWFIQANTGYDCGGLSSPSTASFGSILGNTFSYPCSTSASPNVCTPLKIFGNHIIVENNDLSHFSDGADGGGDHTVFRGNAFHDAHTGEVSTNGDNHLDVIEMSGNGATLFLFEANTTSNFIVDGGSGAAAHGGPLAQCGTGPCGPLVWRFHRDYHIQGAATTADQGNWPNLKEYNNTWVDMQNGTTGGFTTNNQTNEQSGANVNEIYYYTINPTGGNAGSAYHYSGSPGSSTFANNLAWCPNQSSSACNAGVFSHNGASFTSDPGNVVCDPSFVNSASDFHLQAGSCALNAGTNLTTANGAGSSSTTLVVNDANYFQDGWGLPAGNGLGQMTPDAICVTTVSNCAQISAGGINYSTNTITLSSVLSWSNGDKVWLQKDSTGTLRLTGTAPNMGALGTAASGAAASLAQGGNANQNNYPGGSSTTNAVYATNYGIHNDFQWAWDATYTNLQNDLVLNNTFGTDPPFLPSDVCAGGSTLCKQIFCTNVPIIGGSGQQSSTTQLPGPNQWTTISQYISPYHVKTAANASASNAGNGVCGWGTPDDTVGALSPATLAANAAFNACVPLVLPSKNIYGTGPGVIFITHDFFDQDASRNCPRSAEAARAGAGIVGAASASGSYIVISPTFNTATCTHGQVSHIACILSVFDGQYFQNFVVWGLGESGTTGSPRSVNLMEVGRGASSGNGTIENVFLMGLWGGDSSTKGLIFNGGNVAFRNVHYDGFGGTPCSLGGNMLAGWDYGYCGDSIGTPITISGAASFHSMEAGPAGTANGCILNILSSGTVHEFGGVYSSFSQGTGQAGACVAGVLDAHGSTFDVTGSSSSFGVDVLSGGKAYLTGVVAKAPAATSDGVLNNAGGFLFDQCGNNVTGTTPFVNSGTYYGCANAPIAPKCLAASGVSPEACGNAAQGKVAVPATTTTYTINTTAGDANSTIILMPTGSNSGISGAPTCAVVASPFAQITSFTPGTGFTFSLPSNAGISCFDWIIQN